MIGYNYTNLSIAAKGTFDHEIYHSTLKARITVTSAERHGVLIHQQLDSLLRLTAKKTPNLRIGPLWGEPIGHEPLDSPHKTSWCEKRFHAMPTSCSVAVFLQTEKEKIEDSLSKVPHGDFIHDHRQKKLAGLSTVNMAL